MKKIKIIVLFVSLVMLTFALTGCGDSKPTVKLDKYITINVEGYDSLGTATIEFDYDAFNKDYAKKIKINKNGEDVINVGPNQTVPESFVDYCVSINLDKTEGLSNGDVITATWGCEDDAALEYFGVKMQYSDITYTVSGLSEVDKLNPFDFVTVSFSGTSPDGKIEITPDESKAAMKNIKFVADKTSGIKKGDVIKITASINGNTDQFIEEYGCVLEETEKEYTCDNIAYYVEDVNDIPQDMMDKMSSQGEDAINAYVAKNWDDTEDLKNISILGNYYLVQKDGVYGGSKNYLYFIYEITAENHDSGGDFSFYYYVCFNNIIILDDGTCSVDLTDYKCPSAGWYGDEKFYVGDYYYIGYEDLDTLFNKCVTSNIDNYSYTSTL